MPALKFNDDGSRHIHTYVRKGTGRVASQYMCIHPHCSHYVDKELLIGKETICSICKINKFILSYEDLKRAKPRCLSCSQTQEALAVKKNKKILEELGLT